jgi:hypothetical protein
MQKPQSNERGDGGDPRHRGFADHLVGVESMEDPTVTRGRDRGNLRCLGVLGRLGIAWTQVPINRVIVVQLFRLLRGFRMSGTEDGEQLSRQLCHHVRMLVRDIMEFAGIGLEIIEAHISPRRGIVRNVAVRSGALSAAMDKFPCGGADAGFLILQVLAEDRLPGLFHPASLHIGPEALAVGDVEFFRAQ